MICVFGVILFFGIFVFPPSGHHVGYQRNCDDLGTHPITCVEEKQCRIRIKPFTAGVVRLRKGWKPLHMNQRKPLCRKGLCERFGGEGQVRATMVRGETGEDSKQ
jgi:hypothetical protein